MRSVKLAIVFLGIGLAFGLNPALAGSVTIYNCSVSKIWVGAYNNNDKLRAFAATDACLAAGAKKTLTCNTSSCNIAHSAGSCLPNASSYQAQLSGNHIYFNGTVWRDVNSTCPKATP